MSIQPSMRVIVRVGGQVIEDAEWDTHRALNIDLMTTTVVNGYPYRVVAYRFNNLLGENPSLEIDVEPGRFGPHAVVAEETGARDALRELLLEVAESGRALTEEEVRSVREQVAQTGYDPTGHTPAGGRLAGLSIRGQVLTGKTRIRVGDAHYLRHVVVGQEWPTGTTFAAYLESLRQVILDPRGAILLDQLQGTWQLTFAARSGQWQGPNGDEWIIIGYRIHYGYWVTGFQPRGGLDQLIRDPGRLNQRWLIPPG